MTNNNEVRDAVSPDRTLYDRALRASGREAAATLAAAAFTMAYFWAAVWLLEDSDMTILSMPHRGLHDGVLLGGGVAP